MAKPLPLLLLALLFPTFSRGTTAYDPGCLPLSVTDPLGRTTLNQYDALGRLVQTTAPLLPHRLSCGTIGPVAGVPDRISDSQGRCFTLLSHREGMQGAQGTEKFEPLDV